jgi:hypothetical protein
MTKGATAITQAREAAELLPADGWLARIGEGAPDGPVERLLAAVRATVLARDESGGTEAGYGLETEAAQLDGPMLEAAAAALEALEDLRQPLRLTLRLEAIVEEGPDWLDGQARARIEGARSAIQWRTDLPGWIALLGRLGGPADPDYVDWLALDRSDGREWDMGLHRHHLDPMKPFAEVVLAPAHGVLMTSATLTDGGDWSGRWPAAAPRGSTCSRTLRRQEPVRLSQPGAGADRHRCAAGRYRRAGGRLCPPDRGERRRRAGPVHRDPPPARGAWPHCRPPGPRRAAALCPACRSDRHRHAGRHLPRRSARLAARHRRCATGWMCRASRCAWW